MKNILPSRMFGVYVLFFILILQILQVGFVYLISKHMLIREIEFRVEEFADRISTDIHFKDGVWDLTLYNSDPLTPLPNQSGSTPLYIITSEGFIIERSKPINGFLDTTDYKKLLIYQNPHTISTITHEEWRILSKEIVRDNKVYGVLTVSYYQPANKDLQEVDSILYKDLKYIDSKLIINKEDIDTSKLDIRNTRLEVAFELVSNYNQVIINNGRTPSYMDVSYIEKEFENLGTRVIRDEMTKEEFLINTSAIKDNQQQLALIVSGESLNPLQHNLEIIAKFSILISFPFSLVMYYIFLLVWRKQIQLIHKTDSSVSITEPNTISFDKKESVIKVDGNKISIPYASNQYYLCKALFASPRRRWEREDLIKSMGEDPEIHHGRKIYDAALAINKKCNIKLIIYKDKTYLLNPELPIQRYKK